MPVELGDVLLVPWSEFEILRGPEDVRAYLERCGDLDDDEIERRMKELGSSQVVVVKREPHRFAADTSGRRSGGGGRFEDWSRAPLLSELLPPAVTPAPTWIEIRCLGRRGQSYGGSRIRVRMPDGEVREVPLDGDSRVRIDGIADRGTCCVELPDDPKRRRGPPRRLDTAQGVSGRIVPGGTPVGVTTAKTHLIVVEDIPYAHSW